jgi:hypothetical protein
MMISKLLLLVEADACILQQPEQRILCLLPFSLLSPQLFLDLGHGVL